MAPPQVSVVIAAYNAERWLGEAIQSVLDQTFRDFEVIVVDDGSTDATNSVAESFKDGCVRCLRQENRGLSGARNTGIHSSSGEFVAFLDADDLFKPDKLSKQVAALEADPDLGVVSCGFDLIDTRGQSLGVEERWIDFPVLDLRAVMFGNPVLPSTQLIRREWVLQAGLFDESLRGYEDWDWSIRLALAGCRMGWVREVLLSYRRHSANLTATAQHIPVATEAALKFFTRLFQRSDLPPEIRFLEDQAFANVYLDAAARSFGAGLAEMGREWLQMAVHRDPELKKGNPPRWVISLSSHALAASVENWRVYLSDLGQHLPPAAEFRQWNARRLTAQFYAARAFTLKQRGQRMRARFSALRAMAQDPRLLGNRGLLSVSLRPW